MITCDIAKDLYPLYIEGDLSPGTTKEVDEHIKNCNCCSEFYKTGISTGEIIKKDDIEKASEKLDKEMMLKLKVGKLRAAILFISLIFIIVLLSNYSIKRRDLINDISNASQILHQISFSIDIVKNDFISKEGWNINIPYDEFYKGNSLVMRGLNYFEKNSLKRSENELYLGLEYNEMLNILRQRYLSGTFTERDNRALELLKKYTMDTLVSYEDERNKLSKILNHPIILSPFYNIDSSKMAENLERINELTLLYTNYNALPGEMKPLAKDEVFNRLKTFFPYEDLELQQINEHSLKKRGYSDFAVMSKKNNFRVYGRLDAYTGKILSINTSNNELEGDIISVEKAQSALLKFMKEQYGPGYDFNIEYLGINKNFGSNTDIKLHTFLFTPVVDSIPFLRGVQIYADARTGIVALVHSTFTNGQLPQNSEVNANDVMSMEEAIKKLPAPREGSYRYVKTALIKSKVTGNIELVYVFENAKTSQTILINSAKGFIDYAWVYN
jgi:hypothetical protein